MFSFVAQVARLFSFNSPETPSSPAASLITGANIVADNGFTKRVQL